MLKLVCGLVVLLSIVQSVQGQPGQDWAMTYDSGRAEGFWDIYAVADGNYVVCGSSGDSWLGSGSPLIIKIDRGGDVIWSEVNEDAGARLRSIIEADNGDLIACGKRNDHVTVCRTAEDGEEIWWFDYASGEGRAIIELKNGSFLLAGEANRRCYLLLLDGNGDVIWENQNVIADDRGRLTCIRETDGGAIVGGDGRHNAVNGWHSWLVKIDLEEGDVIWERHYDLGGASNTCFALDSTPDGGFAFSGWSSGMSLAKVDANGNQEWLRNYRGEGGAHESYGLVTLDRGGFYSVGRVHLDGQLRQFLVRAHPNGVERWRRAYTWRDRDAFVSGRNEFYSVIVGHDNAVYAAGSQNVDSSGQDGLVVKLEPEIIGPIFAYYLPEDTLFSALQGDTVQFIARAVNQWGDEMAYEWFIDSVAVENHNDTTATTICDELRDYEVECRVSDEDWTSSITWRANVTELYIDTHTPDTLDLVIRRNTSVDFSVSTRAVEGDPVEYEWVLDNEIIADGDSLSILFDRGRNHEVEAVAYRDGLSDEVIWQIEIQDLIVDYWPRRFDLDVPIDTVMEFTVEPFDPEDESLEILWTLDGDSVTNRSWTFLDFDSAGQYQVKVMVVDSSESDSMTWDVYVHPNSIKQGDQSLLPDIPTLYPPSPNPFNSQTTVRYFLPTAGEVKIELFDISGRLIMELIDGNQSAGMNSYLLSADSLSTGLYFIKLSTNSFVTSQRVLLLK